MYYMLRVPFDVYAHYTSPEIQEKLREWRKKYPKTCILAEPGDDNPGHYCFMLKSSRLLDKILNEHTKISTVRHFVITVFRSKKEWEKAKLSHLEKCKLRN